MLEDPAIRFTTTPENVEKYADFMHDDRLDQDAAGDLEGHVLPRDPRGAGQLTGALRSAMSASRRRCSRRRRNAAVPQRRLARHGDLSRELHVARSDRYVILGPSGCGKSTMLKAVGGSCGRSKGGSCSTACRSTRPAPTASFVFQEFDQLLPWKTVQDNIMFALTASGKLARREADERARHYIEKVRLTRVRRQLSAYAVRRHEAARGHRPRHGDGAADPADGRAVRGARCADARADAGRAAAAVGGHAFTILFVTHSIAEAIRIGNRILLLSAASRAGQGRDRQRGEDARRRGGRRLSAHIHECCSSARQTIADG